MSYDDIRCPKCGAELNVEANYCSICGEPISELAKQREELKVRNAGLMQLAELSKTTSDESVRNAIRKLINK